jgi:myo-inositol-1(or 4)-monophosphatase
LSRRAEAPFRDRAIERSLQEASRVGVDTLRRHFRRLDRIERKGAIDFVTRADREAEARVLDCLRRRHPDHRFIAEESWDGSTEIPGGWTWVVDPLDGTTNYAHGLEHHAVSIAAAFDGRPMAGIVADPQRERFYRAARGRGAFLGRKRLAVSSARRLEDGLLVTGFPYDRRERMDELMSLYRAFLMRTHGVHRYGAAALDFAYVAEGRFDGFYEPSLKAWDVAAGSLLVAEAGGRVTDYEGRAFRLFSGSVVAAPPAIHRAMLRVIRETTKRDER